jgi:hypothetical protein
VLSSLLTAAGAFAQPAEFTLIPAAAGVRRVTGATGLVEAARYAGFAPGRCWPPAWRRSVPDRRCS